MFQNREDAGRRLAHALERYARAPGGLVLGIPNGGVLVAEPVSRALSLPLEALICRKLRCASDHALAAGALTETGRYHLNRLPGRESMTPAKVREQLSWTRRRIDEDRALLKPGEPPPAVANRIVILIDDGIITGATMLAAAKALRLLKPARLVAAAPAGPPEIVRELTAVADDCEVLESESDFGRLQDHYRDWTRVSVEQARRALKQAQAPAL